MALIRELKRSSMLRNNGNETNPSYLRPVDKSGTSFVEGRI